MLARCPEFRIHLAAKSTDPVVDAAGLMLVPTTDFIRCSSAQILFVPGGPGQLALMDDIETLDFLADQASNAAWITSVCTGSLLLAAAGLLTGFRATGHWLSIDQLAYFGAIPVASRVVRDRDRMTGAGVTSGIDFALSLVAEILGDDRARAIQLAMEYDPMPPSASGSPGSADPALVDRARSSAATFQGRRDEAARRAALRLAQGKGISNPDL